MSCLSKTSRVSLIVYTGSVLGGLYVYSGSFQTLCCCALYSGAGSVFITPVLLPEAGKTCVFTSTGLFSLLSGSTAGISAASAAVSAGLNTCSSESSNNVRSCGLALMGRVNASVKALYIAL